jgi:hypothetical protein
MCVVNSEKIKKQNLLLLLLLLFSASAAQRGLWPPRSGGFYDHTQRRTTVGRTPLDE